MKYFSKSFKGIPPALVFLEENNAKPISFINGPHDNIVLVYEIDAKQVQDALPYNLLQRALDILAFAGLTSASIDDFKKHALQCLSSR